jgi:hypothetical protein
MRAVDGLPVSGTVGTVGGILGRKNVRLDVCNSEGTKIIRKIGLEIG